MSRHAKRVALNPSASRVWACAQQGLTASLHEELRTFLKTRPRVLEKALVLRSAACIAALNGFPDAVAVMVKAGADVTDPFLTQSAWLSACHAGNVECVRVLLRHGGGVIPGLPVLNHALAHPGLVAELLRAKAAADGAYARANPWPLYDAHPPLYDAAAIGNLANVALLLQARADVNGPSQWYTKSLHQAARTGSIPLVRMLLDAKAVVNTESGYESALHFARHAPMVAALLEAKADVHARDRSGRTPLCGLMECRRAPACAALLLEAKADTEAADWFDGRVALHEAAIHGHADAVRLLAAAKARLNVRDSTGPQFTPLQCAVDCGYARVVAELLTAKADLNVCRHERVSLLHTAVAHPSDDSRRCFRWRTASVEGHPRYQVVRTLLRFKADVHARGPQGNLPLHWASTRGHFTIDQSIVRLLVQAQADVNAAGAGGITPLESAVRARKHGAVAALVACKATFSTSGSVHMTSRAAADGRHDVVQQLVAAKVALSRTVAAAHQRYLAGDE
jgi:ankyrin repeat protein